MDGRNGMGGTALCDDITRTGLAPPALRSHAKFKLHFVKSHSSARMASYLPVGHSATNANDHGVKASAGWLCKAPIINTNSSHLQYLLVSWIGTADEASSSKTKKNGVVTPLLAHQLLPKEPLCLIWS
jgi:hypothetical protein